MVGLLVRVIEKDSNILKKLLKGIDFDKFDFDITYFESYESNMPDKWDYLSELENITSEQAKNRVLNVNEISAAPEFLELLIRPITSDKKDIDTYDDFLQSDYVMSIIIIDHRNIEICCKFDKWLLMICDSITSISNLVRFKSIHRLYKIKNEALLSCFRPKGSISICNEIKLKD